jgi:type I restriction enzyme S subunit
MIGLPKPKSWNEAPLGELAEIERTSVTAHNIVSGTKYVGLEHLDGEGRILAVQTVKNGDLASNKFVFGPEHILYGKLRPYLRKIVRPDFEGVCSTDILPIRAATIDRGYLYHYLRHPRVVEYATGRCEGANLPRISPSEVEKFPVHFPPSVSEQRRIADILDKADTIRRKREFVTLEATALLRAMFFDLFGDVVRNTRAWTQVRVEDVGDVQLGRQRAPQYQTGNFTRPYVRVANVFEDRIDISDLLSMDFDKSDYTRYRLEYGDILLNEGQSTELVGRPAMWRDEVPNCCFQNTLVRFRADTLKTDRDYALAVFLEYLRGGAFARISSKTSSVAHLGAARFASMPFPLPPLSLQVEFGERRRLALKMKENVIESQSEVNDLFNSLVQRAFRGEL